jgi:hypothetical protein
MWLPQVFIRAIDDLKRALDLARASQSLDLGRSLDWSMRTASSILVTRRAALDEVAALLMSAKSLTPEEVRRVIVSHDRDKAPAGRSQRGYPHLRTFLLKYCDSLWEVDAAVRAEPTARRR